MQYVYYLIEAFCLQDSISSIVEIVVVLLHNYWWCIPESLVISYWWKLLRILSSMCFILEHLICAFYHTCKSTWTLHVNPFQQSSLNLVCNICIFDSRVVVSGSLQICHPVSIWAFFYEDSFCLVLLSMLKSLYFRNFIASDVFPRRVNFGKFEGTMD